MPKLRAPVETVLPAIQPNAGIEAKYRKRLQAEVELMTRSVLYWTRAAWRKDDPGADLAALLGQDKDRAGELRRAMKRLAEHWQARFDALAPELAGVFVDGATAATEKAMQAALAKAGFAVPFKLSPAMREGYQAVLQENISLIKSIPEQYLTQVQGDVWRAVSGGYDLEHLTSQLQRRYGVTQRRAAFIAKDQTAKAKSTVEQVRRAELGIKEAIWQHSHAGQEPRQSHVAADGKRYEIDKGMFIDGEWIKPGYLPRCRCTSRAIIPGLDE